MRVRRLINSEIYNNNENGQARGARDRSQGSTVQSQRELREI
jgi:hypothetical protein